MQAKGPKNRHKRRNTGKKAYQQARRPKKQSKGPKSRQKSLKRPENRQNGLKRPHIGHFAGQKAAWRGWVPPSHYI